MNKHQSQTTDDAAYLVMELSEADDARREYKFTPLNSTGRSHCVCPVYAPVTRALLIGSPRKMKVHVSAVVGFGRHLIFVPIIPLTARNQFELI